VFDELPPFLAEHFDFPRGLVIEENIADERLADADAFHGFEILGDAVAGDVVADPVVIAPRRGLGGRMGESGFERIGGGG
jgi:hypothetical protein